MQLGAQTSLGVGGRARYAVMARRLRTVLRAAAWARRRRLPMLVMGAGSNLLVADAGFDGLLLRLVHPALYFDAEGLWAAAGASWGALVAAACARGLAGVECLAGIPGSVGAAPVQNIGAYGQELADVLVGVWALPPEGGLPRWLPAGACQLGYRSSRFRREPGWVVLAARLRLAVGPASPPRHPELAGLLAGGPLAPPPRSPASPPSPQKVAAAVLQLRARKGMLWRPAPPSPLQPGSAGSFFVNPVVSSALAQQIAQAWGPATPRWPQAAGVKLSAAWLIERAGFERGLRAGPVGLSDPHVLALVNRGGGRATQLVALAGRIRAAVRARFGISLRPEVAAVGFSPAARDLLGL